MIIGRYNRALHNILEAHWRFKWLSSATLPELVDEWKSSIGEAKMYRITNPASMDIMKSQITTPDSLKETTAALL